MRVVGVENLTVGLIVGRPVVDESGQILLNKGVPLSPLYIRALADKGYASIYVADTEDGVQIEGDEDLNPATRAKAILTLRKAFDLIEHKVPQLRERSFDDLAKLCASDMMRALMSEGGPFDKIQEAAGNILKEVLTRATLAGLTSIKSVDSKMYSHSIDVCVVAIMVARGVGLDDGQLRQLATGCLLHDIGKLFVDREADALSQVRQHTLLGYELLKNCPNPDILAPHVALEHHERQNGEGEPRGLVGSNTLRRDRSLPPPIPTLVGEIAALANAYDNLQTGSLSQPPMTPDSVVQTISAAAGSHFNREVVTAFLRLVPVYPLGTKVIVRSKAHHNFTGLVSVVNQGKLDKPTITIFRDNEGERIAPIEINMAEDPDVRIRGVFS